MDYNNLRILYMTKKTHAIFNYVDSYNFSIGENTYNIEYIKDNLHSQNSLMYGRFKIHDDKIIIDIEYSTDDIGYHQLLDIYKKLNREYQLKGIIDGN